MVFVERGKVDKVRDKVREEVCSAEFQVGLQREHTSSS